MLSQREIAALEICRANLDKVDPHPDYVNGGKFAVEPADNPSRGKCYLASAALSEFFGGPKGGYHLAKATNHLGDHYWVVNEYGAILDPTKEQFDLIGERPPYRHGRKIGKRNTLKKHLPLLEAMRAALANDEAAEESAPKDLFGRPLVVEREAALTDEQQAKLTLAFAALVKDWADRPEEFIRCTYPKGALALHFVRALLYGEEIPRAATMAYVPDRYYIAGNVDPISDMMLRAASDPRILRGIRFQLANDASFNKLVSRNIPILGYRLPFDFPIGLARSLINKYCPADGAVLDPCHGWGGRMVGFMLSKASSYVGIDPAPHSSKLQEMFDDLSVYLFEPKKLRLINKPFEDVVLSESRYDFALTSPPYYNTEKYAGDQSSWRRYKTLNKWIEGFYQPMIVGVAGALKPGARFVLQVTPKFKMVEVAKDIGATVGLDCEGIHDTAMRRYNVTDRATAARATELFEVFAVLRKRST